MASLMLFVYSDYMRNGNVIVNNELVRDVVVAELKILSLYMLAATKEK
jgi:hypothetical protein